MLVRWERQTDSKKLVHKPLYPYYVNKANVHECNHSTAFDFCISIQGRIPPFDFCISIQGGGFVRTLRILTRFISLRFLNIVGDIKIEHMRSI